MVGQGFCECYEFTIRARTTVAQNPHVCDYKQKLSYLSSKFVNSGSRSNMICATLSGVMRLLFGLRMLGTKPLLRLVVDTMPFGQLAMRNCIALSIFQQRQTYKMQTACNLHTSSSCSRPARAFHNLVIKYSGKRTDE